MNLHFDDSIAFSYPDEFLLEPYPPAHQYCLFHGRMSIFITLIHDDLTWRFRWQDAGRIVDMPDHQIVKDGIGIPGGKMWVEDFSGHGFQGRVKRTLFYDVNGRFSDKFVLMVLSKGDERIEVRAADNTDFPEDVLEQILKSMSFPGERGYEESREQYRKHPPKPHPNAVKLAQFSKLGGTETQPKDRFRVAYEGDEIAPAQSAALRDFLDHEEAVFEIATRAVFRYYSEAVYPVLEDVLEAAWLPPKAKTAEDVVPLIQLASMLVHEPREDGSVPIGLSLYCDWDPEHGLGVRVVGCRVEAVGTDYVALSPDLQEWPDWTGEA